MTPNKKLAHWRKKQGLTVREAGMMFGVSGQAVSSIENGGTPAVTTANAIDRVTKGPWRVKTSDWGEPLPKESP